VCNNITYHVTIKKFKANVTNTFSSSSRSIFKNENNNNNDDDDDDDDDNDYYYYYCYYYYYYYYYRIYNRYYNTVLEPNGQLQLPDLP